MIHLIISFIHLSASFREAFVFSDGASLREASQSSSRRRKRHCSRAFTYVTGRRLDRLLVLCALSLSGAFGNLHLRRLHETPAATVFSTCVCVPDSVIRTLPARRLEDPATDHRIHSVGQTWSTRKRTIPSRCLDDRSAILRREPSTEIRIHSFQTKDKYGIWVVCHRVRRSG